ncbi:MAG: hypothetical protein ACC657_01215 [Thiohalomonadales bacterium]
MNDKHNKYLIITTVLILLSLTFIYVFNYFLDPLWYFGGNKLFPENYSYNERFSKVNEYIKNTKNYNCIILGSSRVTLLDAKKISGFKCFNFSFSDGNPEEFIAYSKYIRKFGNKPKLTIIGVDARFYSRVKHKVIVPEFVTKLELPPKSFKTYLTFSALNFSIRTLLHKPPQHRYYTDELVGAIIPGTKNYDPPSCFTLEGFGLPYTDTNIHYLESIKRILQSDAFIGYVAPISAWDMLPLIEDGELSSYSETMYKISQKFDRFYDFSVPSKLTERTDNNYDGHHFSREANDQLANILNGGPVKYGVSVHNVTLNNYKQSFNAAVTQFKNKHKNRGKSSWDCRNRSAVR